MLGKMHASSLRLRNDSPLTLEGAAGKRFHDTRLRRSIVVAATRSNWRAEIEGAGAGPNDVGSSKAAAPGTAASESSAVRGKGAAAATATMTPPPQAAAEARSPPASPWAASPAPPKPAQAKQPAAGGVPPAAAAAAAAAGVGEVGRSDREEPVSLPTIDIIELLSEPRNQSLAFTALAGTSAVLSVLCCVEPEAVLDFMLPKALISDLDVTFVRIIGVTLAASAAVEYSLKHAAESQLLKSATYQRLMAGCAIKSVGFLAVLAANTPATFRLWNPLLWLSYAVTAVVAATVNLTVISNTSGNGLVPPPVELTPPKNTNSWMYSGFVVLYLLTTLACFAPETLFTGDPYSAVTPLAKGVWGPGFVLAAVMSYVLKDAADRDRLGASTFKNLNLGLAALEYGYSIVFGSAILSDQVDIDLPALTNLGAALLIATFALYTYATAKK